MYKSVQAENNFKAVWSLLTQDVVDFKQPHPYKDAKYLSYTIHWGNHAVKVDIEGETWLDLYRAADKAIELSGDCHHIFIEQFLSMDAIDFGRFSVADTKDTIVLLTGS